MNTTDSEVTPGPAQNAAGCDPSTAGTATAPNPSSVEPEFLRAVTDNVRQVFGQDTEVKINRVSETDVQPALLEHWLNQSQGSPKFAAVTCGPPSKNLCVLIFTDVELVDEFLKANPNLSGASVSSWASLHCLWLRLAGWCPPNHSTPGLHWISAGPVPVLNLLSSSQPTPLTFDQNKTVLTTTFGAVHWPKELEDPFFLAHTHAFYGPFFQVLQSKKTILNHATVSRILAHALGLVFDVNTQTFRRQESEGQAYESISHAHVIILVTKCLQNLAAENPRDFPLHELQLPRINSMVESIKVVAAYFRTDARQSLIEYVRSRLCLKSGHSLTVEEIYNNYLRYVRERNLSLLPKAGFHRQLPITILEFFSLSRVNNILRPNAGSGRLTARRGYNNLAFRSTDAADAKDASDGSDGVAANPN